MRILHISTRLILGGSQENTVLSCEGQARLGHEVHLAFGPVYGPEGSILERVRQFRTDDGRGITTHVVPHLVREVRPVADRRCLRELELLVRELKPDIVHTHSSKAGVLGRVAAWRAGECGVVHTIHGPPFMPMEGGPFSRAKIAAKNLVYALAEKRAAKDCHVIVSVADAMTSEFLSRGIGRAEQYVTVRSGMEIEPFLHAKAGETREEVRRSLGLKESDFVVGTVARLAEHKGHDDLLDAIRLCRDEKRHLRLLWVGDGWWRERLIARARSFGLPVVNWSANNPIHRLEADLGGVGYPMDANRPRIVVTGLVPPEKIPMMMRAMDVLAHPSYREGLPRTVPQALLCGVCPVAYDCDGTGEVCREMETGRLVPTGDKEKLRDAILWLKDHPRERAEMAERGGEECRVAFSAETMVVELEKVYARAIEMARSG